MKRIFWILIVIIAATFSLGFFGSNGVQAKDEKTVEEEILEILREKGTISSEKYDELAKKVETEKVKESKKPRVGYKRGLFIETADGNFKLQPYMKFRGDFRAFEGNHPSDNTFFIKTARLGLQGELYKYFDFNVSGEFGKGGSKLWDAYIGVNYLPEAKLRIGQYKQPFGLEYYSSADWRDFIEMPLPVENLNPRLDIGLMIHGNVGKGLFNYGVSLANGTGYNTYDNNNGKDVVGRAVFTPFNSSGSLFLKGLHFGGSMSYGKEDADRDKLWNKGKFSTAGGTTFFQPNAAVVHDGSRTRFGAELAWIVGPFSLKGEWIRMNLDDLYQSAAGPKNDFDFDGCYVTLSYILTGETQPFKNGKYERIIPKHNFNPGAGTWGAVQLVGKYETFSIDDNLFSEGYADPDKYTDKADGFALGVNWYLNDMVRVMFNYVHTDFDGHIIANGQTLDDEDLFLGQVQLIF